VGGRGPVVNQTFATSHWGAGVSNDAPQSPPTARVGVVGMAPHRVVGGWVSIGI